MSPLVGRYRPSSRRPKVVLPEPVSPTSARVSPWRIASETPSTAFSVGRAWPSAPRPAEKCLRTSLVSMMGTWSLTGASVTSPAGMARPGRCLAAHRLAPHRLAPHQLAPHRLAGQREPARAGAAVDLKDGP